MLGENNMKEVRKGIVRLKKRLAGAAEQFTLVQTKGPVFLYAASETDSSCKQKQIQLDVIYGYTLTFIKKLCNKTV